MGTVNATNARRNLYRLIDDVNESHEPVTITGKSTSAIPGMREPIAGCSDSDRVVKVTRMWTRYE